MYALGHGALLLMPAATRMMAPATWSTGGWVGAGAAAALLGLLAWSGGMPQYWNAPSDPLANKVERLPGSPTDIEAHGQAARTLLPQNKARAANAAAPFAPGPLQFARSFKFSGSPDDLA